MGSFLDGLERSFSEVDNKIVDFYVTMPEEEVSNLVNITQVSSAQVQNGGSRNLDDFEYEEAVIVAKYDGYFYVLCLILLLYIIIVNIILLHLL